MLIYFFLLESREKTIFCRALLFPISNLFRRSSEAVEIQNSTDFAYPTYIFTKLRNRENERPRRRFPLLVTKTETIIKIRSLNP